MRRPPQAQLDDRVRPAVLVPALDALRRLVGHSAPPDDAINQLLGPLATLLGHPATPVASAAEGAVHQVLACCKDEGTAWLLNDVVRQWAEVEAAAGRAGERGTMRLLTTLAVLEPAVDTVVGSAVQVLVDGAGLALHAMEAVGPGVTIAMLRLLRAAMLAPRGEEAGATGLVGLAAALHSSHPAAVLHEALRAFSALAHVDWLADRAPPELMATVHAAATLAAHGSYSAQVLDSCAAAIAAWVTHPALTRDAVLAATAAAAAWFVAPHCHEPVAR